jgi:2-haloacid dehalogenase
MAEHDGNKPAFVFDIGGIFIDWSPRYLYRKLLDNDEAAVERFLTQICTQEWNEQMDVGMPFAEGVTQLVARYPEQRALIEAYPARWLEMIKGLIQANVDLLYSLDKAGYPLYALSNWPAEKFPVVRQRYDFFNCFKHIMISAEVGYKKPELEIYRLFLERTGLNAEECIFVDDTPPNVEAAQALGFKAIYAFSPGQLRNDLQGLGINIPLQAN